MVNATAHVTTSKVSPALPRPDEVSMDAAAGTIYPGTLLGRDSSGYFTKGDATQRLTEMCLHVGIQQTVDSSKADGTHKAKVQRGIVVPMTIATLTTDANARNHYNAMVFAAYDNEVTLSGGTFANFVGYIVGHESVTRVLVYIPPMTGDYFGVKIGKLSNPYPWDGADEYDERYIGCSSATSDKSVYRWRALPTVAQTTGVLTNLLVQTYGNSSGNNVFGLRSGNFEVGIKADSALLTGGVMCPLRVKVEDLGFDLTAAGTAQVNALEVAAQLSTGSSVGSGNFSLVRFVHEGNVAADQYFHMGPAGGMARQVANFFTTTETLAGLSNWISAGTLTRSDASDVLCDGKIKVNLGGVAHYIPLFN